MSENNFSDEDRAKAVLRGQYAPPRDLLKLAESLKKKKSFHLAWQLLARARRDPDARGDLKLRLKLGQQQALCTYKDPDLPTELRLTRALEILKETDDLDQTTNQETLGLAGAIYKYRWQWTGQREHLERASFYYLRGYELSYFLRAGDAAQHPDPDYDYGYTGINAAFTLDLLASVEDAQARAAHRPSKVAEEQRNKAGEIRSKLIAVLPDLPALPNQAWLNDEWWFLVTIAEAHFGLGQYTEAITWLQKANALRDEQGQLKVPDWEVETTARQLAAIARLQGGRAGEAPADPEDSPAWKVLTEGLGINAAGVRSALHGKVGLALSGGGFRASLFHIGVLAELAELDILRHVEVLSCVSGGSIIGAYYYLALRKLLEEKADGEITPGDYVRLVQDLARRFLEGVQQNLRTQVLAEPETAWRIMRSSEFSQTERLGELYQEVLFAGIPGWDPERDSQLDQLKMQPKDERTDFQPKLHNWRRQNKVPTLILNATTLNSCHNWQFTATFMGESPALIDADIDGNNRLRRLWYTEAPNGYSAFPLGRAVAASACVPVLFPPIALPGLYPDQTIQLVDGGVYDNQGTAGLEEQDCTVLLVSDASGQTDADADPDIGRLGVLSRSNNVLMARVREAEYRNQLARQQSGILRGLMFLHLRKDLDVDPVNWVGCADVVEATEEARPLERRGTLTSYGVRKDVQKKLAALRTDLDAFSDLEAYALMTSGYLMTASEFPRRVPGLVASPAAPGTAPPDWPFLVVQAWMTEPGAGPADRLYLLEIGRYQAFKFWRLSAWFRVSTVIAAAVGLALLGWFAWASWPALVSVLGYLLVGILALVALTGLVVLAGLICPSFAPAVKRGQRWLARVGFGMSCLLGCPFGWAYLKWFNARFLRRGRVTRAENLDDR